MNPNFSRDRSKLIRKAKTSRHSMRRLPTVSGKTSYVVSAECPAGWRDRECAARRVDAHRKAEPDLHYVDPGRSNVRSRVRSDHQEAGRNQADEVDCRLTRVRSRSALNHRSRPVPNPSNGGANMCAGCKA